jgi:hypothetical protein
MLLMVVVIIIVLMMVIVVMDIVDIFDGGGLWACPPCRRSGSIPRRRLRLWRGHRDKSLGHPVTIPHAEGEDDFWIRLKIVHAALQLPAGFL